MMCMQSRNIVVRYPGLWHSPNGKRWNRSGAATPSRISFWLSAVLYKMNVMRIIYYPRNSRCEWVTNNTNTNHAKRARVNFSKSDGRENDEVLPKLVFFSFFSYFYYLFFIPLCIHPCQCSNSVIYQSFFVSVVIRHCFLILFVW